MPNDDGAPVLEVEEPPGGPEADAGEHELPARPGSLYEPGCDKRLAPWGVTRQFNFGQFVILYHREDIGGQQVSAPVVITPEGSFGRVVEEGEDDAGAAGTATTLTPTALLARTATSFEDGKPPPGTLAARAGGVPLNFALAHQPAGSAHPATGERGSARRPAGNPRRPSAPVGGRDLHVALDDETKLALLEGKTVDTLAEYRQDRREAIRTPVRLPARPAAAAPSRSCSIALAGTTYRPWPALTRIRTAGNPFA